MTRLAKEIHHKNANQPFFSFSPKFGLLHKWQNISATESTCGEDRQVFPIIIKISKCQRNVASLSTCSQYQG
jgi:hypothetical protein